MNPGKRTCCRTCKKMTMSRWRTCRSWKRTGRKTGMRERNRIYPTCMRICKTISREIDTRRFSRNRKTWKWNGSTNYCRGMKNRYCFFWMKKVCNMFFDYWICSRWRNRIYSYKNFSPSHARNKKRNRNLGPANNDRKNRKNGRKRSRTARLSSFWVCLFWNRILTSTSTRNSKIFSISRPTSRSGASYSYRLRKI